MTRRTYAGPGRGGHVATYVSTASLTVVGAFLFAGCGERPRPSESEIDPVMPGRQSSGSRRISHIRPAQFRRDSLAAAAFRRNRYPARRKCARRRGAAQSHGRQPLTASRGSPGGSGAAVTCVSGHGGRRSEDCGALLSCRVLRLCAQRRSRRCRHCLSSRGWYSAYRPPQCPRRSRSPPKYANCQP